MSNDLLNRTGPAYFLPPRDWFWHWQENGRVAVWQDGLTIVFRDELETVLRHLVPQGWPPLGSLVLLLAACRDNWHDTPGRAIVLTNLLTQLSVASGPRDSAFASLRSICDGLDRVRALPTDLRHSLSGRAALAALVFETAKECTSDKAAAELLARWPQWRSEELQSTPRDAPLNQFYSEMYALLGGLAKVDERTLRLRLQTGLDVLPELAPVESDPAKDARTLIDQLVDDSELCGVAYIARQLLSVVSLPRPVSNPAEMPEGGVSDISNRGSLDRLLLSELAHDDMTLAVRVALNEALYYRRETPPSPPPRARKLLFDAGVRMWGVPRVFAAAVGLALAASREKKLDTTAYRAHERFLDEVDLHTRDGLVAHLAALETAAHPGDALAEFRAELADDCTTAEAVLITCDEVLADPEFQRELARCQFDLIYIATVSRSGRYRLIVRSRRGNKVLREATLDLDKLLNAGPRRPKLIDSNHTPLPAIFGVEPFPLLLSVPLAVERSWHIGKAGVLTYTRDGRLLHWSHPQRGASQLAEGLPQGRLLACQGTLTDGKTLAVVGKVGPNGMWALHIDCTQRRVTWTRLQFPFVPQLPVAIYSGRVLVRHAGNVVVIDAETGEPVTQATLSSGQEQIGRIVQQSDGHGYVASAMGSDGVAVWSTSTSPFLPLAAFETEGIEGILVVTREGHVIVESPQGRQRIVVNHGLSSPLSLYGVSRDGRRFVIRGEAPNVGAPLNYALVTIAGEGVSPGTVRSVNHQTAPLLLEPFLAQYVRARTLRTKFTGICVSREGELALIGRNRSTWPLQFFRAGNDLRLAKTPHPLAVNYLQFQDDPHNTHGYSLESCRFPDGTLAWLDGRGLLHLRSSDRALPEATIVLCESSSLAGWLSDGRVWGPIYFHDMTHSINFTEVYDQVLRPMIDRMTQ